jgi:glycosyltransferase involved in cell wall biosynthesis
MKSLRIVTPVFNDWESFSILLRELDKVAATLPFPLFVSAVDDGSLQEADPDALQISGLQHLAGVESIRLSTNVGHQRAIAIGLCIAVKTADADAVLIMDADGEDPPAAIATLTDGLSDRTDFCRVAQRAKRSETRLFKLFYFFYKSFFKALTGKTINFGNFSILSASYVKRLVMISDLWNNLPAAVLRSRLPIEFIPIHRGRRYAGKSKMNFTSLIVHGLSGISVYADTIFVRLLMLSGCLAILGALLVATVLFLRIFVPAHATPGWATTIVFGITIILLQVLFTAVSSILMLLNNRVQRLFLPIADFEPYVSHQTLLFGKRLT